MMWRNARPTAEGQCDRCEARPVYDTGAPLTSPDRWLCKRCLASKRIRECYIVKARKGEAWVAHLMRLRARAMARLPLFSDQEDDKEPQDKRGRRK